MIVMHTAHLQSKALFVLFSWVSERLILIILPSEGSWDENLHFWVQIAKFQSFYLVEEVCEHK